MYRTRGAKLMHHICPFRLTQCGITQHDVPDTDHESPSPTAAAIRSSCLLLLCGYTQRYAATIVEILDTSGKTRRLYRHIPLNDQANRPCAANDQRTARIRSEVDDYPEQIVGHSRSTTTRGSLRPKVVYHARRSLPGCLPIEGLIILSFYVLPIL